MSFDLDVGSGAVHLPVAPGTPVILRGAWAAPSYGLSFDACQTGSSNGHAIEPRGLVDFASGGFRLTSRDWTTHTCTLVATGTAAPACAAAGVMAPCLPSRLRIIAAQLPVSVQDLRADMAGGITVDAQLAAPPPAVVVPPVPGWLPAFMPFAVAALCIAIAFGWIRRARQARARSKVHQVVALVKKVRARALRADPVFHSLADQLDELGRQAHEIARIQKRLRTSIDRADIEDLRQRMGRLRTQTTAEAVDACEWLERQIDRVRRMERESERTEAGLDRTLEYVRALEGRIDDATSDGDAVRLRVEDDRKLLREIERDVQSAVEAAREADGLVRRGAAA